MRAQANAGRRGPHARAPKNFATAAGRLAVLLLAVLLGAAALAPVRADTPRESNNLYITDYQTTLEWHPDNSVDIEERVKVKYVVPRHGVYFWLYWRDADGKRVILDDLRSTGEEDGHIFRAWAAKKEYICFGNLLEYKESGDKVRYDFAYTYRLGKDKEKGHDVIYWNIIGDERPYRHDRVSFTLKLPAAVKRDDVEFFVGSTGGTDGSRVRYKIKGQTIVGEITDTLRGFEAVTVKIRLPEGTFGKARRINPVSYFVKRYLRPLDLLPLVVLLPALALYFFLIRKDPAEVTPTPHPPAGVTPAEAPYLLYGQQLTKDFYPLLLKWMEEGALFITDNGRDEVILTRQTEVPDGPQYEQQLFLNIFNKGGGSTVPLVMVEGRLGGDLATACRRLEEAHDGKRKPRRGLKILLSLLMVLAALIPGVYFLRAPLYRPHYSFATLIGAVILFVILGFQIRRLLMPLDDATLRFARVKEVPARSYSTDEKIQRVGTVVYPLLLSWVSDGVLLYVWSAVAMFAISHMIRQLDAQPGMASDVNKQLLGLKRFFERATPEQITALQEENPRYFYRSLPYAMALGVEIKWREKYKNIPVPLPIGYVAAKGTDNTSGSAIGATLTSRARTLAGRLFKVDARYESKQRARRARKQKRK